MAKKSKKTNNIFSFVFAGVIVVGLILAIVGLFVGELGIKFESTFSNDSSVAKLFDEGWGENSMPSNTFAIISFIVTIVGLVVLAISSVLKIMDKDIKIVTYAGIALAVVGGILILASGLSIVNEMKALPEKNLGETLGGWLNGLASLANIKVSYSCGAGVWLGFIGGLVGGVAGGLGLLKNFN